MEKLGDDKGKFYYADRWAASNTWHSKKSELPIEL